MRDPIIYKYMIVYVPTTNMVLYLSPTTFTYYSWVGTPSMVLEKTLESPLDCKEIKPVHPKGNQSWIFIGRTDAEVETPILWPPDVMSRLIRKDPDAGEDWRQKEKRAAEDEMVG